MFVLNNGIKKRNYRGVLMYKRWQPMNLNYAHFSDGQGVRMRETIEIPSLNFYEVETTVASLYEPYKGKYFTCYGGTSPCTEWSDYSSEPNLFQWGFDYDFVDCGDGSNEIYFDPTTYEDISFTYDMSDIHLKVKKEQLYLPITQWNPSAIVIRQLDENQPRKCWNNPTKGGATDGWITHFKDGIINTNIDIYPKDSTQINDPNLIHNLDPGLYKIDKQYNDGTQDQNLILKTNNE